MVWGKESIRADGNLFESRTNGLASLGSRPWMRIIGAGMIVLLAGSSVFGDFMVQPIIMRREVHPGKRVPIEFHVENLSRDMTEQVSLRLCDLTQDTSGVWKDVRSDDPDNTVDLSTLRSCKSWLTCTHESVQVDPYQRVPIGVVAEIPPGTRGFYFAALVAETAPRQTQINGPFGGALLSFRYLVPIILEVQGVAMPHDVKLVDVDMRYQAATLQNPTAAVIASMGITNKGGTYSRLQGHLRILQESKDSVGSWRRVADLPFTPIGIIPGVSLNLEKDVGMLLPSGKYKVEGYLFVDGRRGNAFSEELDFKGDPRVPDVRALVPISLDKDDLMIDVVPGSGRGGSVMVTSQSEEPVTVNVEFVLPEHMQNVVSGEGIRGDDLSCVDWVNVMPSEFTLQRYARRSVNLNVKMPPTATQYSHYYGMLRLHVTYADGTSAGMRDVRVCVKNTKAAESNVIDPITFTFAEASPSRYIATATFRNQGVTYVNPRCRGILTGPGEAKYEQFLMTSEAYGQTGIFLPFETRTFSGVLDVSNIDAGVYRLTAYLEFPGRDDQNEAATLNAQNQWIIEIYEQGGQKVAKIATWDKTPDGKAGRTVIKL